MTVYRSTAAGIVRAVGAAEEDMLALSPQPVEFGWAA